MTAEERAGGAHMGEEELEPASASDAGEEVDEEDAEGSTGGEQSSGDDDGEESDEEEDNEEDDDEEEESEDEPAPRRKKFRIEDLPQREMPNRATRANRYSQGEVVAEAEEGDEDFWNQDFFAEEAADGVYVTESEPEDLVDRDFYDTEDEDDEDSDAAEAAVQEKRKKTLKPPGQPRLVAGASRPPRPQPAGAPRRPPPSASIVPLERRGVRASTRVRVEEAEAERRRVSEAAKLRRPTSAPPPAARMPTQAELLAEAARTEVENLRSLAVMEAAEESAKDATHLHRVRYAGPMIRWQSRSVDGGERTTLEVRNTAVPPELQPRSAPTPVVKPRCVVTGAPARYRDPLTGAPYADAAAFAYIRRTMKVPAAAP